MSKTLKDCCSFQEGYVNPSQENPQYFDGDIKWLRTVDLNDSFVYDTSRKLSKLGFESAGKSSFMFKKNTLAISKSGTIGTLGILKCETCGNRAVINIDVQSETASLMYIYYLLKYKKVEILSKAVGSIQKNLYVSALETIALCHDDKVEQDKIANVLSTIDEKIEINNKINAELETLAKTIYDYWFVQFEFPDENGKPYKSSGGAMEYNEKLKRDIPVGWEVKPVNDIFPVKDGTHDSPKSINCGYSLITSKHLMPRGLDFGTANTISEADYNAINQRSKVDTGDILFSMIGSIGTVYKVDEKHVDFAIKNVALYKTSQNQQYKNFVYMWLKSSYMKIYISNVLSGSIQKFIGLGDLRNMPIFTPNHATQKYTKIMSNVFDKSNYVKEENQQLTTLRDWLLPMLRNGQVSVE